MEFDVKDVLGQIQGQLQKIDNRFDKINDRFDELQKEVVEIKVNVAHMEGELKGEIQTVSEKVDGLNKRVDTQDFVNRAVISGLIVTLLAGAFKMLFPKFFGLIRIAIANEKINPTRPELEPIKVG